MTAILIVLIFIAVGVWLKLLLHVLTIGRVATAFAKLRGAAQQWAAQQQAAQPPEGS